MLIVSQLYLLIGCLVIPNSPPDQDSSPKLPSNKLVVATKESPPFSFKNRDGQWTGISIELWKHLSDTLNLEYEFREQSLEAMLAGLKTGEFDAAVAAISVTAERHQQVEFCHPHFTTGLGIAVPLAGQTSSSTLLFRMVSTGLVGIVAVMIGIVLVCGVLFWLCERGYNESVFGGKRRQGIGMGIWWATIVLLGHKGVAPISAWGRILAVCAMVISILLFSLLTGIIASVLTVQQLDSGIHGPEDLAAVRVVTIAGSTSAEYLTRRRIRFRTRPDAEAALQAVTEGGGDAAVYDAALLRYLANRNYSETVQVLPMSFHTQEYAIALPPESPLRKPLNGALLRYRASDSWDELVYRYLGE